ncbi:hypothetical protein H257_04951 [Aphanomyces astaci]|uniref:Peptidase A2 domain-containing protein n=1 Tax=Aphanomyces astaci TaxID=112090 RepID=W4GSD8_APHAT|nr:hypothetical protein H257_04951 [Aphanomyces astaci]ETV82251.1 hypothetical protein H257_04951 [Aphanomyces astaci]|eukprot:XP_009827920.1 hypothetical protein H257_04951 [Aphanomyces astaci]
MSLRHVVSNVLATTAMIAISLVAARALIANMDGDQDSLMILEMAGGTTIGTTVVTTTVTATEAATANATKATTALIVEVVMTRLTLLLVQPLGLLFTKAFASMDMPTPTSSPNTLCLRLLSIMSFSVPTHHRFYQSAHSATCTDIINPASETSIKVVLQLPLRCVDGVRPHPPFQVVGGLCVFALHADLCCCKSDLGDPPLPMSVTFRPNDFLALQEHLIVDSGASASCIPNRDYFSKYVPCALYLTVGNGAHLPVLGYGPITLAVDMPSRDQADDIRPCAHY